MNPQSTTRGQEEIIERIRKLLALSRDPANEHEAALAADRVRRLLLKHNLSLGDITPESESVERVAACYVRLPYFFTPLANACKFLFDIEWFMQRHYFTDGMLREIVFCGLPQNVATAFLAFDYFIGAVRSLGLARRDLRGRKQHHSYLRGAALRIAHEAKELKESAAQTSSPETSALIHIGNAIARRHLARVGTKPTPPPPLAVNRSMLKGWLDAGGVHLARAGRKQVAAS